jgi:hypothetical protein
MIPLQFQAIGFALAMGASFLGGVRVANDHAATKAAKAEAAAQVLYLEKEKELNDIAASYEELRSKRDQAARVVTRTVTRIIASPEYQRECFDADGVRAANSALRGSGDPGEPSDKVQPIAKP